MDSYFLGKRAFSLFEISLAISVMAIFLTVILLMGGQLIPKIKQVREKNDLNSVAVACQQYYASYGLWPGQLSDLQPAYVNEGVDFQDYILTPQVNILVISTKTNSITAIKPLVK